MATTLAIPFAVYASPAQAAVAIEANNKAGLVATDRVYDTEIKIYKDQKNEPSMVSQYIKNPKVKIENERKVVTATVQDSDYFQYLRIEDENQPGIFHDVKVLSEDKRKNGTKIVQFEIGEFSKKYNMQMHILIPALGYDHKYQVQFEMIDPTIKDMETEKQGEDSTSNNTETDHPVDSNNMITDKKLRELVNKKALHKKDLDTPITKEELLQVKDLFLNTNEILDYSGLKYMPNLESLTVANAKIKDPSFFANLKQVKKLALRGNEFADVTPLVKMDHLESLDLSNNKITNVAPLAEMKNVTSLSLTGNQIEDVTALAKMEQLDYLNVANNKITNIAPLSQLKNVTYLSLAGNEIEDITPLYTLPLHHLVLTRNKVKDLSGIHQLNQLEELWIGKNQIEDVTPLTKMSQLKVLDLPNNELKDITPLSTLVNLQKLDLEANYITDLSPISQLKKLTFVSFIANEIRDVRPVIELSKQAYIDVQNQKIFLEDTEVNKEVQVPIYEKDGEISTKIRLKSDGGTYNNGVITWNTLGEQVYEFGVKDPFADTGIFFTGTVIQNIVEKVSGDDSGSKDNSSDSKDNSSDSKDNSSDSKDNSSGSKDNTSDSKDSSSDSKDNSSDSKDNTSAPNGDSSGSKGEATDSNGDSSDTNGDSSNSKDNITNPNGDSSNSKDNITNPNGDSSNSKDNITNPNGDSSDSKDEGTDRMNPQVSNKSANKQTFTNGQMLPATGHATNWLSVFGGGLILLGIHLYRKLKKI
ncbi:leucine-rich repeat domain-containing protein [Bacillus sp. C1]